MTFQHTKYPNIEEKMKRIIQEREEALAAHELARTRMANQPLFHLKKDKKYGWILETSKPTTTRRSPPNKKDHLR